MRLNGQNAMFTLAEGATLSEEQVHTAVTENGLTLEGFRTEQVAMPPAVYVLDVSSFPT